MPNYSTMICLVGENPLPVYLGIMQLSAPNAHIILVHSRASDGGEDTSTVAKRIRSKITGTGRQCMPHDLVPLDNPYEPQSVDAVLGRLATENPDAALNYTGGTKVMSGFSLLNWGRPRFRDVFYLEERNGLFHFGIGPDVPLARDLPLSITDLCELHGVDVTRPSVNAECSRVDLVQMHDLYVAIELKKLMECMGDMSQNNEQFSWFQRQYHPTTGWDPTGEWAGFLRLLSDGDNSHPWYATPLPATLNQYAKGDEPLAELARQFRFAAGTWIEQLVESFIPNVAPRYAVLTGQRFEVQGQEFESDVMTVVDQRLRYLSMTLLKRQGDMKGKMFQAIHRARQIGGGLAKTGVVCMGFEADVRACNRSIGSGPRQNIYGRRDVKDWIDGDYTTLNEFLVL